jgi:hypothetical protein
MLKDEVRTTVHMPEDVHRRVREEARRQSASIRLIVLWALQDYFAKIDRRAKRSA